MIELKNISKRYSAGKNVTVDALRDVNLTFADAGLCFIVGKSGSGKSTLLNLLGGLDGATSGEIVVNGKKLGAMSGKAAVVFLVDYRFTVYRDRLDAYVDGLPQGNGYLYQERVRARIQRGERGDETGDKRGSERGQRRRYGFGDLSRLRRKQYRGKQLLP